ncbi:MAG: tRNA 2-selenouridine(34) synthase MnmH [Pseudomonadota bacterium]
MGVTLTSLSDIDRLPHDAIIDARSPSEFAEDHVPGAINLPVLDDAERAQVGTIYAQESPFRARKVGAALVARNAARHLEETLADVPGGWRPLVYCWRGGQRSGAFASILTQIGWRADTLVGGYRSYRRLVVRALYETRWSPEILVLDGNTGTAKTALLERLSAMGAQVIDLEGLARHRGSILGPDTVAQPAQKAFETELARALGKFTPGQPVIVEAESSKVGDRVLPPALWAAMRRGPRIVIEAPIAARAAYLAGAYSDLSADPARLCGLLAQLRSYHGARLVEHWQGLAADGDHVTLAKELVETHYDPRYAKSRDRWAGPVRAVLKTNTLDAAALDQLAVQILALMTSP